MAIITKDQNGSVSQLAPNGFSLGVGTSQIGKEFEVVGVLVSRESPDAGGTCALLAAEPGGLGSLWTNNAYDPANPGSGFRRTINLLNGNVGIGGSKDEVAKSPSERLVVAGNIFATGDVRLAGADCAEEFPVRERLEPGTVVVIGENGELEASSQPYDTRVAGILSGAATLKPGIVLGKIPSGEPTGTRMPLALAGTAYCNADGDFGPIRIGDLLTTSPTSGHAMKVSDPSRAFGAVIGKAMQPLAEGRGLILVLITLQ